ncbi:wee1-like protein kinase isoform X2 [Magnolia sinica]|uniref:wee1-like protein kinase isoform X2 n=1 Tax=Magnolia sinica TaxID=86752 RepID=UPI002658742A|nr:wee1-like protein kinase isoform X2 [Magnolia sinica]
MASTATKMKEISSSVRISFALLIISPQMGNKSIIWIRKTWPAPNHQRRKALLEPKDRDKFCYLLKLQLILIFEKIHLSSESFLANSLSTNWSHHQQVAEFAADAFGSDDVKATDPLVTGSQKKQNYVSQSAVALRCRVMPPICIKNPYLNETAVMDLDIFGNRRSKSTGFFPSVGGDGLSRYRTDFHEIEQIGSGNFSLVFKVLKRIDGCMYAVKRSIKQLHQDTERRRALMEVQALAALGCHENIVGYYTSWFENEQLYIQMELCDHSLSINEYSQLSAEGEVLDAMYQIAKALHFIHGCGIAHLDVKPDNIYVKGGVYKLGDFGCATLIDRSLPIEEGDARYMPQEILNDKYEHLDKVDIFSLGAAIYELVKGSSLPESGPQFLNLREGKISLLPGHSMQFQNLLKAMVDPDPIRRPSAKELVENPIFERACGTARIK